MAADVSWDGLLLHGGYLLFLTAFVLRDILWLRLATVCGYLLFSALAIIRGGPSLAEILPWYVAFISINGVQIALLARERWIIKMSPSEAKLWSSYFPTLDPVLFKRFLRAGVQRTLSDGFVMTSEGRHSSRLFLIMEGNVEVCLGTVPVARLGPGRFVGEIGFVGETAATATATARTTADAQDATPDGTCCVVWNVPKLRKLMRRDGELKNVIFAAVGGDLAHKIAEQTVSTHRRLPPQTLLPPSDAPGGENLEAASS